MEYKTRKAHKDDYSNTFPVYTHNITNSTSHHAYIDKSIKGSIVIQNHSINIKIKSIVNGIDDKGFLVTKSYYFKGQFLSAEKNL